MNSSDDDLGDDSETLAAEESAVTITRQTPAEVEAEYLGGEEASGAEAEQSDAVEVEAEAETEPAAEEGGEEAEATEQPQNALRSDDPIDDASASLLATRDAVFAMQSGQSGDAAKGAADKVSNPLTCRAIANFCERAATHKSAANLDVTAIDDVAMGDELERFENEDGITREDLLCLARQIVPGLQ